MTDAALSPERTLVVTGAGGFVGKRLVRALRARGDAVIGIGRSEQPADWPADTRWVRADLGDAAAYESALAGATCVIHLAAVTGKARPAAYQRGNVDATRTLVEASTRAGVSRFIFVSSIAAAFPDRRHYPYADSKIAAEQIVREATIASVIVRPTMILGQGSPIEESLGKLASLPVSPVFGDGANRVQPIDVDDVVDLLVNLTTDAVQGETIEVGGRDTYSMRDLYARLREAHGGKGAPSFVHAPLGLSRWGLALIEGPLLPLMPLTAGQLATFANDSVAERHDAVRRLLPNPRSSPRAREVSAPPRPGPPATPPDERALSAEFTRSARYILGGEVTAYQIGKYIAFHQQRALAPANAFDALLLRLSSMGGVGMALADSYSGLLYRTSIVRAKLVLTLAILEASPPSFAVLDKPGTRGPLAFISMGLRGAMTALSVCVGALVLLPAQILLRRRPA